MINYCLGMLLVEQLSGQAKALSGRLPHWRNHRITDEIAKSIQGENGDESQANVD